MNKRLELLRQQHDEYDKEILKLHQDKQQVIRDMQAVCTHDNTTVIEPDPFLEEMGVDDEVKVKCQDCFKYFEKKKND